MKPREQPAGFAMRTDNLLPLGRRSGTRGLSVSSVHGLPRRMSGLCANTQMVTVTLPLLRRAAWHGTATRRAHGSGRGANSCKASLRQRARSPRRSRSSTDPVRPKPDGRRTPDGSFKSMKAPVNARWVALFLIASWHEERWALATTTPRDESIGNVFADVLYRTDRQRRTGARFAGRIISTTLRSDDHETPTTDGNHQRDAFVPCTRSLRLAGASTGFGTNPRRQLEAAGNPEFRMRLRQ